MTIKVLFVCSGNTDRSPTAEALLKFDKRFEAKSAGICEFAPVKVTGELLDWADVVFAMEEVHKRSILRIAPETKNKVVALNIPDNYPYGSPRLVRLLIRRLKSNGILIPYGYWNLLVEENRANQVLEKRRSTPGSCGCGGKYVVAYDGERVCQNCGKVQGRENVQRYSNQSYWPSNHWSGSQDNQEKQLENDVEKRGWG